MSVILNILLTFQLDICKSILISRIYVLLEDLARSEKALHEVVKRQ